MILAFQHGCSPGPPTCHCLSLSACFTLSALRHTPASPPARKCDVTSGVYYSTRVSCLLLLSTFSGMCQGLAHTPRIVSVVIHDGSFVLAPGLTQYRSFGKERRNPHGPLPHILHVHLLGSLFLGEGGLACPICMPPTHAQVIAPAHAKAGSLLFL